MAAILFLLAMIIAIVHWCGGHLFGAHYLDAFFTFLAAGLFCLAMGWEALPIAIGRRA